MFNAGAFAAMYVLDDYLMRTNKPEHDGKYLRLHGFGQPLTLEELNQLSKEIEEDLTEGNQ
jgi:hypothetical protein